MTTMAVTDQPSVRRAVEILVEHGANQVILFGSTVQGSGDASSDLDLACRGLPSERFFQAYGRLLRVLGQRVDLVDLDTAKETLRARIEREGRLVHGA